MRKYVRLKGLQWLLVLLFIACADEQPGNQEPLHFFVIGDWGERGSPNQMVVAYQMKEWAAQVRPAFIISTGDNFYNVGVEDTQDAHWQESFESVYQGSDLAGVPWYVALGNHDYYGNPEAEVQYSTVSSRWRLPSRYHTFVVSTLQGQRVRFVITDTTPLENSYYSRPEAMEQVIGQDTTRQLRWLDSLTSLNDVDWKIVVGHQPIYTGGVYAGGPNSVRTYMASMFERNKVDMYFGGHEHDLQHLQAQGRMTHYFISGAGSKTRPTGTVPETVFSESVLGFIVVSVLGDHVTVKLVNYKGKVIHEAIVPLTP